MQAEWMERERDHEKALESARILGERAREVEKRAALQEEAKQRKRVLTVEPHPHDWRRERGRATWGRFEEPNRTEPYNQQA